MNMLGVFLILIVSFFLDGVLSNFLPFMINELSLFTPFFTLVCLVVLYPFFKKEHQKYFILVFITGFCYDLFYTNLLFTNAIIFFSLSLFTSFFYKKIEVNVATLALFLVVMLALYHSIFAFLLFAFNIVPIHLKDLGYLILHSLILNVLYGEILYFFLHLPKRKRRLN